MRAITHGLRAENGALRGLTGQGEPGLWTLLGGTGAEEDANSLRLGGGAGQVSGTSRVARAYRDTRIAYVAAGQSPGGYDGSGAPPIDPNPGVPERPR